MQTGEGEEEAKEEEEPEPEPDDFRPPARPSHARTTPSSLPVSTSLPPSCAEQARDHTGSSPTSSRNGVGFGEEIEEDEGGEEGFSFCLFFLQGCLPSASAQSLILPSQEAVTSVEEDPDDTREQHDSESAWAWQEPTTIPVSSSLSSPPPLSPAALFSLFASSATSRPSPAPTSTRGRGTGRSEDREEEEEPEEEEGTQELEGGRSSARHSTEEAGQAVAAKSLCGGREEDETGGTAQAETSPLLLPAKASVMASPASFPPPKRAAATAVARATVPSEAETTPSSSSDAPPASRERRSGPQHGRPPPLDVRAVGVKVVGIGGGDGARTKRLRRDEERPPVVVVDAADAAAAATGGAAADSIAAAAGSELPSPHKLDSKVGGWLSVQAGWLVGLRLRVRRAA